MGGTTDPPDLHLKSQTIGRSEPMAAAARAARGRIPKRGLGLGSAVRRIRELHGVGQETLAERSGVSSRSGTRYLYSRRAMSGSAQNRTCRRA